MTSSKTTREGVTKGTSPRIAPPPAPGVRRPAEDSPKPSQKD